MKVAPLADTPPPPYYAVVFTSIRTEGDHGYGEMAQRMFSLAAEQPGFLGVESARDTNSGITVSYWASLEDIKNWKKQEEHLAAQREGRSTWYQGYRLRICKVERDGTFPPPQ